MPLQTRDLIVSPRAVPYWSLLLLLAVTLDTSRAVDFPIRGVWLTNVGSGVLSSPKNIEEFVALCDTCGVNTICVVVWNRGLTVYPSAVMDREFGIACDERYRGRDVLQEVIDAASRKNIRVWAWFEFGFSSSYGEPDGGHIIRRKPNWAARNRAGELVSKNGFQWMNAFHSDVQDFMLALLKEVAAKYPVEAVQGDDRLPANPSSAGYDEFTCALYANEHQGRRPPENYRDTEWINWRSDRLNRFAERMHNELEAIAPKVLIAGAPSVYPWSKEEYLQDWPTWVKRGWVDVVSPQIYRANIQAYRTELSRVLKDQVPAEKLRTVFPGVLVRTADGYRASDSFLREMIEENRRQHLDGEIIFYDAGLVAQRAVITALYKD